MTDFIMKKFHLISKCDRDTVYNQDSTGMVGPSWFSWIEQKDHKSNWESIKNNFGRCEDLLSDIQYSMFGYIPSFF